MGGCKTKKTLFEFDVQKDPIPSSSSTPSARKPYLDTQFKSCQDSRKSSDFGSGDSVDFKEKEACRNLQ